MSITIQSICCPLVLRLTLNNMVKSARLSCFAAFTNALPVFYEQFRRFCGVSHLCLQSCFLLSAHPALGWWWFGSDWQRRTATSAICWGSLLSYFSGHVHCWVEYSMPQKATRKGGDVCSPVAWHQPLYGHPQIPCIEWPCLVGLASSASCSTRFIYTKLGHAVAGGLCAAASAPFFHTQARHLQSFPSSWHICVGANLSFTFRLRRQNHWNVFSFRWGLTTPCPLGLFLIFNCFGIHFFKTYIKGCQAISTPLLVPK